MYKFFLLDADMTLFDFDRAEKYAWFETMKIYSKITPDDLMYDFYHDVNAGLWKKFERGETTKDSLVIERHRQVFRRYGVDADPIVFNECYLDKLGDGSFPLPGALDFAKAVREIADERGGGIYITTNGVERIQTRRLAESVFAPLADEIFVSETAGHPKPDMRYFDYVFSRIDGFDPALAVIVGDSLTSDIQGCNNAGIFTLCYNTDGNPNDTAAVPDFEAADYDEIIRFIKEH